MTAVTDSAKLESVEKLKKVVAQYEFVQDDQFANSSMNKYFYKSGSKNTISQEATNVIKEESKI
jgi:hypothetical protein